MTIADGRQFSRATASACRPIRTFKDLPRPDQQVSCRVHRLLMPVSCDPSPRWASAQTATLLRTWTTCRRSTRSRVLARAGRLAMPMQCVLAHAARAPARACTTRAMPVSSVSSRSTLPLPVVARQYIFVHTKTQRNTARSTKILAHAHAQTILDELRDARMYNVLLYNSVPIHKYHYSDTSTQNHSRKQRTKAP